MPDFNSGNKKEPSWFSSLGSERKPKPVASEPTSESQKTEENTKNVTNIQSSFLENQIGQVSTNQKPIIEEFDSLKNLGGNTSEQTRVGKSVSNEMDGLKKGAKVSFSKKELSGKLRQVQPDKMQGGIVGSDNAGGLLSGLSLFGLPKFGPGQAASGQRMQGQAGVGSPMQAQTMPKSFGNSSKNKVVSITYEEIGLFPRSFSRVFDRFFKQIFSDVENLVIQEYRFYRYLFLTTIKTLCILFFVPLVVNFIAKTYLIRPITEYYWNTQQTEIFLNSYEQKRAFSELHDFEEKLYFELFLGQEASKNQSLIVSKNPLLSPLVENLNSSKTNQGSALSEPTMEGSLASKNRQSSASILVKPSDSDILANTGSASSGMKVQGQLSNFNQQVNPSVLEGFNPTYNQFYSNLSQKEALAKVGFSNGNIQTSTQVVGSSSLELVSQPSLVDSNLGLIDKRRGSLDEMQRQLRLEQAEKQDQQLAIANVNQNLLNTPYINKVAVQSNYGAQNAPYTTEDQTAQSMVTNLQDKILELAIRYNNHSIEAITNFFADFLSLISLFYLLVSLEIQINITKSFLLEVFFGLDDSKKSLLILIMTDLLVGYHSSNLWELFFQFIFNHYGIPESQTGIFLLVATLPVLLDVLFKYLIFRHLNRSSPATVATYHAIIE